MAAKLRNAATKNDEKSALLLMTPDPFRRGYIGYPSQIGTYNVTLSIIPVKSSNKIFIKTFAYILDLVK